MPLTIVASWRRLMMLAHEHYRQLVLRSDHVALPNTIDNHN